MDHPDFQDILQHPDTVNEWTDLGATLICPIDGDFGNGERQFSGKVKDFNVECETVAFLQAKQDFRRIIPKHLETAL